MISDILNIVLSYVDANSLLTFFIQHKLDFRKKFAYDAQSYYLEYAKFDNLFLNFPNIKLNGINITNIIRSNLNPKISMNNILYVKFGTDSEGYYEVIDDCELASIFINYPNIIGMTFSEISFSDLKFLLNNNNNLNFLIFDNCVEVWGCLSIFVNFSNLKLIKILNYNIYTFDSLLIQLSRYSHIEYLIFENCIFNMYLFSNNNLICKNLRCLKFINCVIINKFNEKESINVTMFEKCKLLRRLNIINCGVIKDTELLKNFKYLKNVIIR